MDIESERNSGRFVGTFRHLLKLVLLIIVFTLLALYVFSLPLGLELFLFENLSTTYSPSYQIQVKLFNIYIGISLSHVFVASVLLYISCFILAFILSWKFRNNLYEIAKTFFSKPISFAMKNFLFALPVISSLTYIAVVSIQNLEASYGMPIGTSPLPEDTLLAFFGRSVSPITEEIIYRILPIGVFLAVRLLTLGRREESSASLKERLKIFFLSLASPENAKKMFGLKTVNESGFRRGISHDEWVMIFFTSFFFALSHYFTGTWMVGKIASTFIEGLVMGLAYLIYGFYAPILIHWFFNYYFYTYSLATTVHPTLAGLGFLNENLTWSLGVLAMLIATYSGLKRLAKTRTLKLEMLLSPVKRVKNELIAKTNKILFHIRRLDRYDLAMLALIIVTISMRLVIVNVPAPEAGENYSETGLVFDESYYVKAARKMLVGEASNNEHPPLAKAFFMLGIILFGDTPLGWRISSIITSSISLALVYGIVFLLCRKKSAAFFAALLFATDIMAFNIGQIAILDAPSMLFVLAGSILLLKGRNDFGGLFFGLASLCKLNAMFASAGVVFFLVLSNFVKRKKDLKFLKDQATLIVRIFLIAFVTLLIGLWIYDVAYRVFNNNPLEHLIYMYNYHGSLRYTPEDVILGKEILPLEWINPLNSFSPIPYYVTTVREILSSGIVLEYHPIAYYGIYTPLWWSIWALVPISLIETVRKIHRSKEQGVDLFAFVWIAANFFPYVLFGYLMQRWVYPFYFYMSLPGLYAGLSYYLTRSRLLKIFLALLIGVQLVWFFIWFPVKPKVVIDFLRMLGLPA